MKRKEIALIKETRQSKIVNKIMDTISQYLTLRACDKVPFRFKRDLCKYSL
jgi:hypothetical protein